MRSSDLITEPQRPLVGRTAAACLVCGSALALALLWPFSAEREVRARLAPPDLLSLAYLKLGLGERPGDAELRLALAERSLEAGLFEISRQTLAPLAESSAEASARARNLSVELEFRAWAATSLADGEARGAALERFKRALARLNPAQLPEPHVERLAELCASTGELALRARLLTDLAEREPYSARHVALAEEAELGADAPMRAAELHERLARGGSRGEPLAHARRALELARSAHRPREALALFARLDQLFPDDAELLELGLSLSAGQDDRVSLALAERLLAKRPNDVDLRRRVAELSDWTGLRRRATAHYVWLGSHGGGQADFARALERARATSDLALALALTPRAPRTKPELLERIALHEALGNPREAIEVLDGGLAVRFSDDLELWQLKFELHQRAADVEGALQTLAAIEQRFPRSRALGYVRANLLLSLGRSREALDVLADAPEADAAHLRKLGHLAWELGDTRRAREAYATLVGTPEASEWDFQRLWLLAHEAGDYEQSIEAATGAWQRFHQAASLDMAISSALAWKRPELVERLLTRAEAAGAHFTANPAYWELRIGLRQRAAERALDGAEHRAARSALEASEVLLQRASRLAPEGSAYHKLWDSQRSKVFTLALAVGDRNTLARVYPSEAPRLAPRERVFVLYRLGRNEEAAQLALESSTRSDVTREDRAGLAEDARTLTQGLPRHVGVSGGIVELGGLRTLSVGASAVYHRSEYGVSGSVELSQLLPANGQAQQSLDGAQELTLELTGRAAVGSLTLGVVTRDMGNPRPLARLNGKLAESARDVVSIDVRVNDRSFDGAAARVLAVEDEALVGGRLALPLDFFLSGRASAKAYSTRDRHYLGAGVTLDAAVGRTLPLPRQLGEGALRLQSYIAPRFAADARDVVPSSTTWLGAGASLGRGELGVPVVTGRRVSFLLDAAGGWSLLEEALGWWAAAGIGLPVVGGDMVSLSARAGNVLNAAPGSLTFALNANYAVSEW